ncbi:hypothetical protein PFY10_17075 [Chryseobacterium daecheongense]|nr:hypothetical protein PFY10_17075 [Chryseobacterium daecheongense]
MTERLESYIESQSRLEIHYWFNDNTHTMDAIVQNRCEYEVLGIIKEVAKIYSLNISIETEPFGEGGLKRWLKVISKEENKKATISTAIITALLSVILIVPLTKISEKFIDKIFEDTEMSDLQKEKLKLEIDKLKKENSVNILENPVIKKRKSNFYETLEKYPKVDKISFEVTDENKSRIQNERVVKKNEFKEFILISDDLDPIEIEDAIIEIISPVLKKGHYKWTGYLNGEPINFNMKSNEFKTLVQNGKIEFKNGSSINCALIVKKKIDNDGAVKITGYDVIRVNHYFENEKPIETKEGKNHRQKKDYEKNQPNLFTYLDEEVGN